jgi:ribonuclease P protein component
MQRAFRLRANADIQRVRTRRRSWANPLAVLYAAPNELGHPRVAISVSRRIGKAVVRNRVRRRIREAIRPRLAELKGSHDLLFIARSPGATAEWPALRDAVDDLLRRAGLLSARPASGKGQV